MVYHFKGPTHPTNFVIWSQLKNGDISLQQEKQQKDFKKELNEITSEIQDIKAVINYM